MHSSRRRPALVAALALPVSLLPLLAAAPASAASPDLVISQVYGGGGNAGAPFRSDFVELFNTGGAPVDLTGWAVQYASAAGAFSQSTPLAGSVPPGGSYLVKQADGANAVAQPLPTPDATGTISMSGTAGKVRLLTRAGAVRDLVGYGAANDSETSPTPALTNTTAAQRTDRCVDTDVNNADFRVVAPAPRTSASEAAPCGPVAPPGDAPLTITNPSPATHVQGTTQTYAVSGSDADDAVGVVVGDLPAGVTTGTSGAGTGTATVTVTVGADAPAGTATVPIAFSTPEEQVDSPFTVTVQAADACGVLPDREIAAVQGSGARSPLVGQPVRVEGVVVGDFQGAGEFGGFYVQDPTPDADPLTSDAVRVFNSASGVDVGDVVRVAGTVEEFGSEGLYVGSETQLGRSSTVQRCGTAPLPAPAPVTLPFAETVGGVDGQERFEGTLTTLAQDDLVATDLFTLGRFGEVSLTTGEVLYIPTTAAEAAANDRDRITLDDGLSGQNLPVLPYTVDGDGSTLPRAGDTLAEPATGVLTFAFGEWRVEPAVGTTLDFRRTNPREPAPEPVGGNVKIASFNVLNYFVDFGGENRGARNAVELQRQQAKLVSAITTFDADVVGLIEIANDDGDALRTLVTALNDAQPGTADDYTAVQAPAITDPDTSLVGGTYGTDAIRTAIIYRAAVVGPTGPPPSHPALLNPADPAFPDEPVFDRPPAVQEFLRVGSDRPFTFLVNHFKSKGSSNEQCGTPDPFGGNCDDLRERQSAALLGLVDRLGAQDVALAGDFNSYEDEAPVAVLEFGGFTSSVADQPREERTSYSFDGEFGSLDYVFLSDSLLRARTGADIWQINSPEAPALQYSTFNQPQLYAPDPYASSDHDAEVVGLDLLGPAVRSTVPADGARLVDRSADLVVVFDEELVPSSTAKLAGPQGPVAGTVAVRGDTLVFDPARTLPGRRGTYTLTLCVEDLAGNRETSVTTFSVRPGNGPPD